MISPVLIAAMIWVESRGNDHAAGQRGELGCLQITAAVVTDCNAVQNLLHFTLLDRLDREKSIQMCEIYLAHYATAARIGHEPTDQDCARIWNGGPSGWADRATAAYWTKVQAALLREGLREADKAISTPGSASAAGVQFFERSAQTSSGYTKTEAHKVGRD